MSDMFDDMEEMSKAADADMTSVSDRKHHLGVLIRFRSLETMDARNITHESVHAADRMFSELGVDADNNNDEPLAYLAGWIADCCEEVKKAETKRAAQPTA